MKNPDNPNEWTIDEPAADVVRQIFKMCIQGLGPSQIAKRLRVDKVMTPREYWISIGRNCGEPPAKKYGWCSDTVSYLLSKQEYIGDTVNFRTKRRSFKNKKRVERPKDEWKVFKNTHPALISEEDYYLVQELRKKRRRTNKAKVVSMFSGLVYCNDCGQKLYYSSTGNYKREQANFFCSTYIKDSDKCSFHYIREKALYELVLEDMRQVFEFVTEQEDMFARIQMFNYGKEQQNALKSKKSELKKAIKRVDEIDGLIQKLFENNAAGKLTDERFETLTTTYEQEQAELKSKISTLENEN